MDTLTDRDPAERSRFDRLVYRDRRPTWLGHWVSQFFCLWAALGQPPRNWVSLQVTDRVSGRRRADAVVIPTVAGDQYVVSVFGTLTDWTHTLEATHGAAVIRHGWGGRAHLVPAPPEERTPILKQSKSATAIVTNTRPSARCRSLRMPHLSRSQHSAHGTIADRPHDGEGYRRDVPVRARARQRAEAASFMGARGETARR